MVVGYDARAGALGLDQLCMALIRDRDRMRGDLGVDVRMEETKTWAEAVHLKTPERTNRNLRYWESR